MPRGLNLKLQIFQPILAVSFQAEHDEIKEFETIFWGDGGFLHEHVVGWLDNFELWLFDGEFGACFSRFTDWFLPGWRKQSVCRSPQLGRVVVCAFAAALRFAPLYVNFPFEDPHGQPDLYVIGAGGSVLHVDGSDAGLMEGNGRFALPTTHHHRFITLRFEILPTSRALER